MPAYSRAELEQMVERWLDANRRAEAAGDWTLMANQEASCHDLKATRGVAQPG